MDSVTQMGKMGKGLLVVAVAVVLALALGVGQGQAQLMPGGCWVRPDGSVWCTVDVFLPMILMRGDE